MTTAINLLIELDYQVNNINLHRGMNDYTF